MKKIILLAFLLSGTAYVIAQTSADKVYPKTIEVEGAAEMEILPDQIYAQIELKEYIKKGVGKQPIEQLKTEFLAACKKAGIADSAISISNYEGSDGNYYLRRRHKKDEELLNSITYQILFSNTAKIDQLVNFLDENATEQFNITRTSHSKIIEYRKQLKVQAIRAAKEKANYLANAIDEQVGVAVTITEPAEYPNNVYMSNSLSQTRSNVGYTGDSDAGVAFRKIKLRFAVNVVFALK